MANRCWLFNQFELCGPKCSVNFLNFAAILEKFSWDRLVSSVRSILRFKKCVAKEMPDRSCERLARIAR